MNGVPAADGYYTMEELGQALGLTTATIRVKIRGLVRGGQMACGKTARVNIAGVCHRVPGYKVVSRG